MDPLFRDQREFLFQNQATFTYYAANAQTFEVIGNRAKVTLNYDFELPEIMLGGKMIQGPEDDGKDHTRLGLDRWRLVLGVQKHYGQRPVSLLTCRML